MHEHPRTHVHLELEARADPISGTIRAGAGPQQSFSGWIELASVIEHVLADVRAGDAGASVATDLADRADLTEPPV